MEPHSLAGEHTDKRLMLNDDESVQYRQFVLGLIALSEEKKKPVTETLSRIDRKSANTPELSDKFEEERQSCLGQLREIDNLLSRFTGGGP